MYEYRQIIATAAPRRTDREVARAQRIGRAKVAQHPANGRGTGLA